MSAHASMDSAPLDGLRRRRPVERDRRRVLHQAARRRRRRGRQGRAARGRSAAPLVGVGRRDRRRRRRRAVQLPRRARSRAWSSTRTPTSTSTRATRCWPAPTRWCGRAGRPSPSIRCSRPPRSARAHPHLTVTVDHAVRPGRSVERPAGDRVHAAGVVGRDRRPRPRLAGPGAGVRRRPDRRVAHRRVRRRRRRWRSRPCAATAAASSSTCRCSRP